jgi:hypothetical protein
METLDGWVSVYGWVNDLLTEEAENQGRGQPFAGFSDQNWL